MAEVPRDKILCPNCGAPLPPAAARQAMTCPFCGLASTPAQLRPAAARPAQASAAPVQAVQTKPSERSCPRCAVKLFEGSVQETRLEGCGSCGGIWMDNEGSARIVEGLDTAVANLSLRASQHATAKPDLGRAGVPCPTCGAALRRVRVSKADVDVDVCDAHGTWFDRDELTSVAGSFARPPPPGVGLIPPDLTPNVSTGSDAAVDGALIAGGALAIVAALLGGSKS